MDENQKNKQVCDLLRQYYPQYKIAALYLDEFTGTTSLLALNEIRNAIDHLARAAQANEETDEVYVEAQLEKAKAHFARAVYDSCDAVLIETRLRLKLLSKRSDIDLQRLNDIFTKTERLGIARRDKTTAEIDNSYIAAVRDVASELKQLEQQATKGQPNFFASRSFWNATIALLLGILLSVIGQWLFTHIFGK